MSVAKVTEIIASSPRSFEDAVESGVERACKTLKGVKSVWVKDQNCVVENGKITEFRVTLKLVFVLEN
ncbi:MAG: dodecin domain-containing protein [Planctomycetes bacterium]|nr:dodecin domain-containing protein [Planctomycetota bacterium]